MMEYILMSFFMLLVIIILIFFLGWFEFSQLGAEQEKLKLQRSDDLMRKFIASPILVQEDSVFDDARLMAVQSLGWDMCQEMQDYFGGNWFIEIEVLNPRPGCGGPCDASTYPCCGYWELCPPQQEPLEVNIRALPVNVYRQAEGRTDLGVIRVGAYE